MNALLPSVGENDEIEIDTIEDEDDDKGDDEDDESKNEEEDDDEGDDYEGEDDEINNEEQHEDRIARETSFEPSGVTRRGRTVRRATTFGDILTLFF